ncbi:SAS053 family DNA gyrase inhibitor [Macrococcoides bohemicum]
MSTSHDNKNEMVTDFDEVVELGKEMEQISEQNAEAREEGQEQEDDPQ